MKHYGAICPHSGGLTAEEFEVDAEGVHEAYDALWRLCIGSRYVGRMYEMVNGAWVKVWEPGQPLPARKGNKDE